MKNYFLTIFYYPHHPFLFPFPIIPAPSHLEHIWREVHRGLMKSSKCSLRELVCSALDSSSHYIVTFTSILMNLCILSSQLIWNTVKYLYFMNVITSSHFTNLTFLKSLLAYLLFIKLLSVIWTSKIVLCSSWNMFRFMIKSSHNHNSYT